MPIADVIVVGDGIAGLSCALACARRGLSVAIVGARSTAAASRASAGVVAPSVAPRPSGDPVQRFFLAARDGYPAWLDALLEDSDVAVPYRAGVIELESASERGARAAGDHSRPLDSSELAELEPELRDPDRYAALLHERDGAVEVPVLLDALETALARRGVRRVESGARGIEPGRRVVVQTPAAAIEGGAVVVAGGAWSAALDGLPSRPPVTPLAGATALLGGTAVPRHVVFGAGGYLVPRERAALIGATSRVAGFDARATGADRRALTRVARRLLGEAELRDLVVGLRPMTRDGAPMLGPDPRDARVIHASGYGRNGVLVAPLAASCVAALVAGERPPYPLEPFAVDRFREVGG